MIKDIIILHSNDIHADFISDKKEIKISQLSQYIREERSMNNNVLYCISGDILCGSLMDKQYKGLSTIEIINTIKPDILSIGNHDLDYGLGQALLLEKCAKFPIICANLYLSLNKKRVFESHKIIKIDGIKILFIGVITSEAANSTNIEYGGTKIVKITDEVDEIEKICNYYKFEDIDFTVILSHVGFEKDKQIANNLNKECGVDLIIGGHTHTNMDRPVEVNGIPIIQLAGGADSVGKLKIKVDEVNNNISSYEWELVNITKNKENSVTKEIVAKFQKTIKHENRLITVLNKEYLISGRDKENKFAMLLCDSLKFKYNLDIMMLALGSVRSKRIGPKITHNDIVSAFPFDDKLLAVYVTFDELEEIFKNIMRNQTKKGHYEFYEISEGIKIEYHKRTDYIKILLNNKTVLQNGIIKLGIQEYHLINSMDCFGFDLSKSRQEELSLNCLKAVELSLSEYGNNTLLEDRIKVFD